MQNFPQEYRFLSGVYQRTKPQEKENNLLALTEHALSKMQYIKTVQKSSNNTKIPKAPIPKLQ